MNGWVMPGTPSWSFGSTMPCQWTAVANGRWLSTTIRTRSPSFTRSTGPGTTPLNAYACLVTPGATSIVVGAMSRWKTFTPASSVKGARTVPSPRSVPALFASSGAGPPEGPPVPGGCAAPGSSGTSCGGGAVVDVVVGGAVVVVVGACFGGGVVAPGVPGGKVADG